MKTCADCGRKINSRTTRCAACYAQVCQKIGSQGKCDNCQKQGVLSHHNMCKTCYNYQSRTGKPRPPELFLSKEEVGRRPANRKTRRTNDNHYGGPRYCIQIGCHRPSVEDAPWGMGFCKYCLPRIEKMLRRQHRNRGHIQGVAYG